MSAICSLLNLKFCSFGTMLPTLWDSQIRVLGPVGKKEIFKPPILAYFGHFSGSLRLILTQPTSHWSYIIIMPVGSNISLGREGLWGLRLSNFHSVQERVTDFSTQFPERFSGLCSASKGLVPLDLYTCSFQKSPWKVRSDVWIRSCGHLKISQNL